ncbi:MAG: hypothetical protein Q7K57_17965 [Burkholderiaceae bacterium]|jgi:hypothetical protein|nr:hypothetical protein [Polaromonas sp.]MDO8770549.1 hypothetical protein [Burkholderiaceae bacterium]
MKYLKKRFFSCEFYEDGREFATIEDQYLAPLKSGATVMPCAIFT